MSRATRGVVKRVAEALPGLAPRFEGERSGVCRAGRGLTMHATKAGTCPPDVRPMSDAEVYLSVVGSPHIPGACHRPAETARANPIERRAIRFRKRRANGRDSTIFGRQNQ